MALEWLETILGAAYTPDIDAAVAEKISEGFVARAEFNAAAARATELETRTAQLREAVKTRDGQLAELKSAAGENEALARRIEELTRQNRADKARYEKELAQARLLAAADAELTAAGSRNNTAVRAVMADFLAEARLADGRVVSGEGEGAATLAAEIERMKRDPATGFLFGAVRRGGWRPGESGDGRKAGAGKAPAEMTYSELAEYLAENPGAELI